MDISNITHINHPEIKFRATRHKDPETYLSHVAITLNNLGILDEDQNQVSDARKEYEEALRIYRGLAEKEPETYLPYVAATLINVGILDRTQNEPEQVRKAFEEALNIYKSLAKHDPDQFSPLVERVKELLKNFPK